MVDLRLPEALRGCDRLIVCGRRAPVLDIDRRRAHFRRLILLVEQYTVVPLATRALAYLDAEKVVPFGTLRLHRHGIQVGDRMVPWHELERLERKGGVIRARFRTWGHHDVGPYAGTPCAAALIALCEHLAQTRWRALSSPSSKVVVSDQATGDDATIRHGASAHPGGPRGSDEPGRNNGSSSASAEASSDTRRGGDTIPDAAPLSSAPLVLAM